MPRKNVLPTYVAIGASGAGLSAHAAYKNTVLGVQSANLIAYWPLDEASGTTADNAEGTAARDGSYTGVTLDNVGGPFTGGRAGLWDGVNDWCDIYTANFDGVFDGQEGSWSAWVKMENSGVWTDGLQHDALTLRVNANNQILFRKTSTNNELQFWYEAGNTIENFTKSGVSTTGWFHVVYTWSLSNDRFRVYYNGSQEGTDQTGLGTWAGSLSSSTTVIGSFDTAGSSEWQGHCSHVAVWTTELTAANVTTLYNGGPS